MMKSAFCLSLVLGCVCTANSAPLEIKGSVLIDANSTGPFYDNQDQDMTQYSLRSAKVATLYSPSSLFKSKLQLEYDSDIHDQSSIKMDDVINDAYGDFNLLGFARLRLGKMKENSGFERNTSSKNLSTTERSMASSTFLSGRNVGIKLYNAKKSYGWALGFYEDNDDNKQSINGSGYINLKPVYLGLTMIKQALNDELFQLKSSGEINNADNIIRSGRFYAHDSLTTQLDALYQLAHWRVHTSYTLMNVQQTQGETFAYQGGFIQMSHAFNSQYSFSKGKQKSLKQGWELVMRLSAIDLLEQEVGSEASIITLGGNYYQGNGFKYMANLLIPQIKGQVRSNDQDGLGLSVRAQYQF